MLTSCLTRLWRPNASMPRFRTQTQAQMRNTFLRNGPLTIPSHGRPAGTGGSGMTDRTAGGVWAGAIASSERWRMPLKWSTTIQLAMRCFSRRTLSPASLTAFLIPWRVIAGRSRRRTRDGILWLFRSSWGRVAENDGSIPWKHSDMKDMAYLFVYRLFKDLVLKGKLKGALR